MDQVQRSNICIHVLSHYMCYGLSLGRMNHLRSYLSYIDPHHYYMLQVNVLLVGVKSKLIMLVPCLMELSLILLETGDLPSR